MRKAVFVVFIMLTVAGFVFAEGKKEATSEVNVSELQDGFYFAQEDGFSEKTGWKYMVSLEVENGEIVDVEWNGAHRDAGYDKVYRSENGMYGMVENGGAQAPWYVQAERVEKKLLETQDLAALTYDDGGYTDAVSGVSIHINEFVDTAKKALAQGPVGRGPYKDGYYHAEYDEFSHGWRDYVDLTVVGGYIVAARWDAYPEEGDMHKYEYSKEGMYGMVENGGAQAPWWEQVDLAEAHLLEIQDPSKIEYLDEDGHVDGISGVSIHVKELFGLAEEALEEAK